MVISIIVAVDKNNLIGANGTLPWHISEDLRRFKEITMGKTIIMGRKTYESIGRPLPGRNMVVISRTMQKQEGIAIFSSLDDALSAIKSELEVFIIGGARLFSEALPLANKLYLTRIDHMFAGDVYFPDVAWDTWEIKSKEALPPSSDHPYPINFCVFQKRQKG